MHKKDFKFLFIFTFLLFLGCEENNKEQEKNDIEGQINFPTVEKVEYVFACMQGNEDSLAYMQKCSCSIDYIESQMTYDEYVNAETIMSLRQIYGEKSVMFRQTPNAMRIYSNFQNIAAEAEMECL